MEDNLAIVGSGPAGYTAGLYGARASLKPVLFEGLESGGQLMLTTDVENYPGFKEGIMGPDLMQEFKFQAEKFGTKILPLTISSIKNLSDGFELFTNKESYFFKSVIISSGASAKWLGIEGEKRLQGYGVSACATCDGFFFKDKVVIVVGGGDSAVEESLFLTKFAQKVYVVHRRDSFRASSVMQERVLSHEKIEVLWNKEVEEINGKDSVTSVSLKDTESNNKEKLKADAVFIAIGHTPNVGFLEGLLELDDKGYIKTGFTILSIDRQ